MGPAGEGKGRVQISAIYEPVQVELLRVEETLRRAGQVDGFSHLVELLDHILDGSGKHIRPVVTLLSAKFQPHDPALPILMGAAVEMLHIATLVHDDTIDKAAVRRGRPTVSNLWGREVAVLLGDYVFAKSATIVCDTGNVRVIRLFAETIMALSAGELCEYMTSYSSEQTREQYWKRIGDKTASLFATAAESGAVLSGASERDVEALRSYGHNLGIAYQIIDDILDFEGSEDVIGKPVGSDLLQGVMTLPAILLAERHPEDNAIKAIFDDRDDLGKLRTAVEMIRSSSIMEEANRVAQSFCQKARDALKGLPDIPARHSLAALTEYVTLREK